MRVTVTLKEVEHQNLKALANENEVSLSWVVRKAIKEYLKRNHVDQTELNFSVAVEGESK
jgi:predicted transcriptional regulator